MRFDVLTLFPRMISSYLDEGILAQAIKRGLIEVRVTNIRDYADGPRRTTDDRPYGGGEGMVMKPDPIHRALGSIEKHPGRGTVILLSPQGETFRQATAWDLAEFDQLVMICGRYEGIDERIRLTCVDRELSIGDFVLTGGELGALVVMDTVSRLIPRVLGGERSNREDTFEDGILEYPHYTRPRVFLDHDVPAVLLSGDHEKIRLWRRAQAIKRTMEKRPELLETATLNEEDARILADLRTYRGPGDGLIR
jgi:tRNA (guanine37-N1)-methyltransferase